MFSFWKRNKDAVLEKLLSISEKACKHSGVSFPLAESDTPMHMRCHSCSKIMVEFVTDEILVPGTGHKRTLSFWVLPDYELERSLKTSPREYGDLKIEKWLRRKGLI